MYGIECNLWHRPLFTPDAKLRKPTQLSAVSSLSKSERILHILLQAVLPYGFTSRRSFGSQSDPESKRSQFEDPGFE